MRKICFLSTSFYTAFPNSIYPEIENKADRPYMVFILNVNGLLFALPFRSNITHRHAAILGIVKRNGLTQKTGIDYTKAVVITDSNYIDSAAFPLIRPYEYTVFRKHYYKIIKGFESYLSDYIKTTKSQANRAPAYSYSTLQYFHKELGI